jgi:hypothetical protein
MARNQPTLDTCIKQTKEARVFRRAQAVREVIGFDHGVGHSLLLLYDAKAPNCEKSKKFKGLGHYPSNTA